MQERGELQVYEGWRITPVGAFIADVVSRLAGENVSLPLAAIGIGRMKLRQALEEAKVTWPIFYRGQGKGRDGVRPTPWPVSASFSPKRSRHREPLMMALAISQSVVQYDSKREPLPEQDEPEGPD